MPKVGINTTLGYQDSVEGLDFLQSFFFEYLLLIWNILRNINLGLAKSEEQRRTEIQAKVLKISHVLPNRSSSIITAMYRRMLRGIAVG
jgi:hypothetical protein